MAMTWDEALKEIQRQIDDPSGSYRATMASEMEHGAPVVNLPNFQGNDATGSPYYEPVFSPYMEEGDLRGQQPGGQLTGISGRDPASGSGHDSFWNGSPTSSLIFSPYSNVNPNQKDYGNNIGISTYNKSGTGFKDFAKTAAMIAAGAYGAGINPGAMSSAAGTVGADAAVTGAGGGVSAYGGTGGAASSLGGGAVDNIMMDSATGSGALSSMSPIGESLSDYANLLPNATKGGGMLSNLGSSIGDFMSNKALVAGANGLLGYIGAKNAPDSNTVTTSKNFDPAFNSLLFGGGGATGSNGLLTSIAAEAQKPQSAGQQAINTAANSYLTSGAPSANLNTMGGVSNSLINTPITSQVIKPAGFGKAPTSKAASISAPVQNNLNLQPAYQDMIYGQPGANPYLTGAIQGGINQSNQAFGNYMTDAQKATQNILSGIQSGSLLNGSLGSSRQGIAQGNAINQYTQDMARAATQYGQHNTDAAVAAQSAAYDQDMNRRLQAMSGLGAEQYGVSTTNAGFAQQSGLANQQAKLTQQAADQQAAIAAARYNQMADLEAQRLQSVNQAQGVNTGLGFLNGVYDIANKGQSNTLGQLATAAGAISPYATGSSSSSTTTPQYNNAAGGLLGGITQGLGLYEAYNKSTK